MAATSIIKCKCDRCGKENELIAAPPIPSLFDMGRSKLPLPSRWNYMAVTIQGHVVDKVMCDGCSLDFGAFVQGAPIFNDPTLVGVSTLETVLGHLRMADMAVVDVTHLVSLVLQAHKAANP